MVRVSVVMSPVYVLGQVSGTTPLVDFFNGYISLSLFTLNEILHLFFPLLNLSQQCT